MNLAAALDAREVRVSRSALVHLAIREHPPRPHGRSLVVYTRCGITAFEDDFRDAARCGRCWTEEPTR